MENIVEKDRYLLEQELELQESNYRELLLLNPQIEELKALRKKIRKLKNKLYDIELQLVRDQSL